MDGYHLGFSSRNSRGTTLGTQHLYYKRARFNPKDGENDPVVKHKETEETITPERTEDGQTEDSPRQEETGEVGNGSGSGSEIATPHPESTDSGQEDTKLQSGDTSEQEQSAPEQTGEQGGEHGEIERQVREESTDGGLLSTDNKGSTEGGDGLSTTDG